MRAWAHVESAHPEWRLRIVGPDELGHASELVALAAELKTRHVSIEKSVAGDAKIAAYQRADLFVLPTLNENFAITVAEALAAGTPVIATKGAPWRALQSEGCGWWIDHGVEPLAAALANAMVMTREALQAMGAKGRAWMARDFSWDRVAHDMLDVYRWLSSWRRGAKHGAPKMSARSDATTFVGVAAALIRLEACRAADVGAKGGRWQCSES